ncbi:MAG: hypothetical protein ACF8SC_04565 [Phycisphaerales bacterium JB037]
MNPSIRNAARFLRSATVPAVAACGLCLGAVSAPIASAAAPSASVGVSMGEKDRVTFRNGSIVEGEILEETATSIKMRVEMYGISTVTTYDKNDILTIKRGIAVESPATPATPATPASGGDRPAVSVTPSSSASRVYIVELEGGFGREITQTPIREAVEDARKQGADYLIFVLDAEWRANQFEELPDDAAAFDQLFRAEDMHPIFMNEIPVEWEKQPEVVFWVKQAMGGAAFLPLICDTIYFAPDARMGGIGNLSTLFGSTGDEVVRQKQYSLRMGHAEGAALHGGYPVELVRAMAQVERVYSYRLVGGKPVFIEGEPNPANGEVLLTDDGQGENEDTIQELARSEGNDVLTLNADLARKLAISKGTVETLDDLLFSLGISRNYVRVDDRSGKILESWAEGVENAERRLRTLMQEFNEIQVQGDYRERTRARGQRRRLLEQMQGIIRKYEESLNLRQIGVPDVATLQAMIERIKLEQLADRP